LNVLLINHYSGSARLGMEYRHMYLAHEFRRAGHVPALLAARYSHLRTVQPAPGPDGRWDGVHEGVLHVWLPGRPYSSNGVARLLNMMDFSVSLWRQAPRLAKALRPDIVFVTSPHPLSVYGARRIARLAGCPFVFEIRDLWPLSLIEVAKVSPSHPIVRLFDAAERYGCRHADLVVSLLPAVTEYMQERGVEADRLVVVGNGIAPDEWSDEMPALPEEHLACLRDAREAGKLVVGYAGAHGVPNALDVLLDAAALLRDDPRFLFVLVGSGMERERLSRQVSDRQLGNVRMLPPVSKRQVATFLRDVDIAYIGWRKVPIYRFGIAPNKLMDYMMAGRAVLHSVEAANDPVRESGCGLSVPAEDPSAVADGLRRLAESGADARSRMGEQGRQWVMQHHAYPVLAQRLLDRFAALRGAAAQAADSSGGAGGRSVNQER
jgi:glycosyltransferase involved in cell wall biosynthesis